MEIIGVSINDVHRKIIQHIATHGEHVITEDGADTLECSIPITAVLTTPTLGKLVSEYAPYSLRYLEAYVPQVIEYSENDFVYTYGNRLRMFPDTDIDQIDESIINRLYTEPTSRRAIAHTWHVPTDLHNKTPPCLQDVQCTIRNDKVNLYATFRSNDMYKAWSANTYALYKLVEHITSELLEDKYSIGKIVTHSKCPHIYMTDAQMIKERVGICLQ